MAEHPLAPRTTRSEVAEADALGGVATAYADIRAVLGVPLVNLVWRHLAAEPGRLERTWYGVRDVVAASRAPLVILPAARAALAGRPVEPIGRFDPQVASTLAAFDRGNAYNLVALVALVGHPAAIAAGPPTGIEDIPPLTAAILQPAPTITSGDQAAFDELAAVASPDCTLIAAPSLLRHLAARPGLLTALADRVRVTLADGLGGPATAITERAASLAAALPPARVAGEPELEATLCAFAELIARALVLTALLHAALDAGRHTHPPQRAAR